MASVVIGKVDEIPPGERKIVVPFRGRAGIGVFNVNGSFYAVRNICPHKNGPLCTGELSGRVSTDAPALYLRLHNLCRRVRRDFALSMASVGVRYCDRALSGRSRDTCQDLSS